jgi:glycogen operon protein
MGRTQGGNNNAYCQDNETSWIDWDAADQDLIEFTAWMIRLRREYPQLRERYWPVEGRADHGLGAAAAWYHRDGTEMTPALWQDTGRYVFGLATKPRGEDGAELLLLLNSEAADVPFALPAGSWQSILDTGQRDGRPDAAVATGRILLKSRSLSLLLRAG